MELLGNTCLVLTAVYSVSKMAGPLKKRALEEESNSASENESENYTGQVIQADFEGRNPEPSDFHGVKQLLQQLFLKAHIDLSQFSDILIEQTTVGSILKQSTGDPEDSDEDEMDINDVFGITSVVNLTEKKNLECIQQLRNLLIELSEKHATDQTNHMIRNILGNESKHVGLIINERFVNIPAQISDPLFESLMSEINRANAKKLNYNFAYYILICKLYKQDKTKGTKNQPQEIYFSNAEEEIFDQEAEAMFEFNVKNESDSGVSGHWLEEDETMTPYRRVLLFPAEKLPNIIQKVKCSVTSST